MHTTRYPEADLLLFKLKLRFPFASTPSKCKPQQVNNEIPVAMVNLLRNYQGFSQGKLNEAKA